MVTRPPAMHVAPEELADLHDRLRRTRWPTPWPDAPGWPGAEGDRLRRLVEHWADGYDWRAHEIQINALPWFQAQVEGASVPFLRYDGESPDALAIVLTHGWPSSVLELTALAQRLATPSRHGGRRADAFTVVVPALPGFPPAPQAAAIPAPVATHELWHRLMHDELGFARYAAHGGDLGAGITSRLGEAHPDHVVGIHLLALADPPEVDPGSLTEAERDYLASVARWQADEGGYQHQQSTRPRTLSYGLSDSPVGLLAWLLEKYLVWTDGPRHELPAPFTDDFVLTQASLYWFTNAISTSLRPYYEHGQGLVAPLDRVAVPTGVAVFPADLVQPPRSWAERTYDVTRYTRMARGGHFAAHEEPDLLAAELREHFRPLRG